jgi:Topoisomerase DNA binding C4 zinc finger
MGLKAPRGFGWFTNPKRAAYNRIYNRTTVKADPLIGLGIGLLIALAVWIFSAIAGLFQNSTAASGANGVTPLCPRCNSQMVLRSGKRGQFCGCPRFPRCRGTRDLLS